MRCVNEGDGPASYLNGIFASFPQNAAWLRVTRSVAVEQRGVGLSVNVRHLAVSSCEEEKLIVRFVSDVYAAGCYINQLPKA